MKDILINLLCILYHAKLFIYILTLNFWRSINNKSNHVQPNRPREPPTPFAIYEYVVHWTLKLMCGEEPQLQEEVWHSSLEDQGKDAMGRQGR